MKKIIIHIIPVIISLVWLVINTDTINPISLKGPEFLKFYLILLIGFYFLVFILKFLEDTVSKTTFYFLTTIFILGIIKLIRGFYLAKPIGYLVMILIVEIGVILFLNLAYLNKKLK